METFITTQEGNRLFCRISGSGPALLLIHGSIVDSDFFLETSRLLSRFFTVITYDRRGYSRSDPAEDYSLPRQAEDAATVLQNLAQGPAVVVGCSLGALIAMRLTACYPELVSRGILHEPPLLCLPGVTTEEENQELEDIRQRVLRGRIKSALFDFLTLTSRSEDERALPYSPEKIDAHIRNGMLFMEHEYSGQFFSPREVYGIDLLLNSSRVCCLAGDASRKYYAARASRILAGTLSCPMLYVPGGHNAARDLPVEFSTMLLGLLTMNP